jgi:hypothetical protein
MNSYRCQVVKQPASTCRNGFAGERLSLPFNFRGARTMLKKLDLEDTGTGWLSNRRSRYLSYVLLGLLCCLLSLAFLSLKGQFCDPGFVATWAVFLVATAARFGCRLGSFAFGTVANGAVQGVLYLRVPDALVCE